jgi:hypothetical protein
MYYYWPASGRQLVSDKLQEGHESVCFSWYVTVRPGNVVEVSEFPCLLALQNNYETNEY